MGNGGTCDLLVFGTLMAWGIQDSFLWARGDNCGSSLNKEASGCFSSLTNPYKCFVSLIMGFPTTYSLLLTPFSAPQRQTQDNSICPHYILIYISIPRFTLNILVHSIAHVSTNLWYRWFWQFQSSITSVTASVSPDLLHLMRFLSYFLRPFLFAVMSLAVWTVGVIQGRGTAEPVINLIHRSITISFLSCSVCACVSVCLCQCATMRYPA